MLSPGSVWSPGRTASHPSTLPRAPEAPGRGLSPSLRLAARGLWWQSSEFVCLRLWLQRPVVSLAHASGLIGQVRGGVRASFHVASVRTLLQRGHMHSEVAREHAFIIALLLFFLLAI